MFVRESGCSLKKISKIACHLRTTVLVSAGLVLTIIFLLALQPFYLPTYLFRLHSAWSWEEAVGMGMSFEHLSKTVFASSNHVDLLSFFTGRCWFIRLRIKGKDFGVFGAHFPCFAGALETKVEWKLC